MYCIHRYAQFGCGALVARSQLSAQPVAPSTGIVDAIGALSVCRMLCWYGHDAPITASPFLNMLISCVADAQYFLMYCRCFFSRLIEASNCGCVSSYTSVMPRLLSWYLR